jgi:large subunit ribosomal protein L18
LVVRPSNKHLTAQVIEAKPDGDRVLASAHSSELEEYGWKGPCGNLPAAYLTGLLAGRRAISAGVTEAVLDIGLHASGSGSRIFAAAKGAFDAGLKVPHDESAFPSKERLRGEHLASYSKQLSSEPETYKRTFSVYLKQKTKPEDLPQHFATVEAKINQSTTEGSK